MSSPRLEAEPFPLVLGLDTFGDLTHDRQDRSDSHAQTIRNVVEQGVLADEVGVDFFGIGEHHTDYFPMPAGDVALAAIAARTGRIRLGYRVARPPRLRAGIISSVIRARFSGSSDVAMPTG